MILTDIIIDRIKNEGPISFRDFMEMALYYPKLGYYNSPSQKLGSAGDYYTSPYLTPSFGAMIGRQIEEMWHIMNKVPFTIVEYGAGTGILCHDILEYLKNNIPLYQDLNYCIIEKSPRMRAVEKKNLNGKVSWHNNINEIEPVVGCILSNELLDNFAVHQVMMKNGLQEIFVDFQGGHFIEILKPASKELTNYFSELNTVLEEDFRTEANLDALSWLNEIGQSLDHGYMITFDYGYLSDELYNNRHNCGTLLCYHQHQYNGNPYQNVGEQDITTHVNFSALMHWGEKYGLTTCGLTNQANFLLALGIKEYDLKHLKSDENILHSAIHQAFANYELLTNLGIKLKVLIQSKGVPQLKLTSLS